MNARSEHHPHLTSGLGGAAAGLLLAGCASSSTIEPGQVAITLCHDERRTMVLTEEEAQEHLDHGDVVGECGGT